MNLDTDENRMFYHFETFGLWRTYERFVLKEFILQNFFLRYDNFFFRIPEGNRSCGNWRKRVWKHGKISNTAEFLNNWTIRDTIKGSKSINSRLHLRLHIQSFRVTLVAVKKQKHFEYEFESIRSAVALQFFPSTDKQSF